MPNLQSIDLIATEPGGMVRSNFPLTMGVPFKPGALPDGAPVAIIDDQGEPRPLQSRVMETHGDGSTRWLLVDYQGDFQPLLPTRHKLVVGRESPDAPAGRRIKIDERNDTLVVDNGELQLEIARRRCQPLERITYRGEQISAGGIDFALTGDDGSMYEAARDANATFEIEEPGPLRLLVRWEGTHTDASGRGHFDFCVRMTVFAGQPFVRIEHAFFNRMDTGSATLQKLAVHVPIDVGGGPRYSAADVYRPRTVVDSDEPLRLEQYALGQMRILDDSGNVKVEKQNNSMGWMDASGANRGLMLAGRNFWQNFPKAIEASADAIACELMPDSGGYDIPRGMAKTHSFFLYCHDGQSADHDLRDVAFSVQRWPQPAASSAYYGESGEVWDLYPYLPDKYPRLEFAMRQFFEPDSLHLPVIAPGDSRTFGWKHYGDFINRGNSAGDDLDAPDTYFMDNEYDTPHVLAMMFLRSREIVKWWGAEAHAWHMMDIDTCHYAPPDENVGHPQLDPSYMNGAQYAHNYQHIGGEGTPASGYRKSGSGSHTFGEGLVDLYHLSGDRRPFEVACGYARCLANMALLHQWGIGRESGWALLVLGSVYKARPDELIFRGADVMVDKVISQQRESGAVFESFFHPNAFGDRALHLCMRGLIKWHQASGDEKTKKLMLSLMYAYLDMDLFEVGPPLYSNWPENSKPTAPVQGFANLESLAYAYDLTGDRRFIDAGAAGLCFAVSWITNPTYDSYPGYFHRMLRGPFRFLAIAHELGILEKVPGAGQWLGD